MKKIIEYLLETADRCKYLSALSPEHFYIKLLQGGVIDSDEPDLNYWEVTSPRKGHYNLVLKRTRDLTSSVAVLGLERTGVFKGRATKSSGRCVLTPEDTRGDVWKSAGSEKAFNLFVSQRVSEGEDKCRYLPEEKKSPPEEHPFVGTSWEDHAFLLKDLPATKDISKKTAIGIAACDRPHYFRRAVSSISEANRKFKYPAFLFLDISPTKSTTDAYRAAEQQIDLFRSAFPTNSWIVQRPRNYGCGRNIIEMRWQLFNFGFQNVYVFEDDMEVSPDYIQWCENIADWAGRRRLKKIGAVQAWSKCLLLKEEKGPHLRKVYKTHSNWWGYRMRKSAWKAIEPTLLAYMKNLPVTYEKRDHSRIRDWFKEYLKGIDTNKNDPVGAFAKYAKLPPTGQDAVTMIAFQKAGFSRLASVVNRGRYIGKSGIHSNPTWYNRDLFHLVTLDQVPQVPEEFEVVEDLPVSIRFNQKELEHVRSLSWS